MAETRICPMDESVAEVWLWFQKQKRLKDLLDRNDSLPSLTWLLHFSVKSSGLGEASCYAGQGTNARQDTNARQESKAGQKRKQPSPMTTAKAPRLSSSAFGDLELVPPISSTSGARALTPQRQNMEEQVLTEPSQNTEATSFLQHLWEEETSDCVSDCINIKQLFEYSDTSLPEDASTGSELTTLF